jgi:glycosyltransferase involved in cell wall biosynthesis
VQFSVLLSVYKNESSRNLLDSINSIYQEQTIKPAEIILIKDGWLTNELDDAIKYLLSTTPPLKVYGYRQNRGLGYALNYGLKKCSNELVFRMDTDDISLPERFEKQLKYLEINPELAIVGSTINEFLHTPNDIRQMRRVPLTQANIEASKNKRNPFNHMTVLFKKSSVLKVGGYVDMPGYEDYYLWMRLLQENKGANISEPLVSC